MRRAGGHRGRVPGASGGASGGAFTLLECLLALAIISGVLIAMLEMRSNSLRDRVELGEIQRADREAEALFQMFVTGSVASPEVDKERRSVTWEGEFLGHPYRAVRVVRQVPNPALRAMGEQAEALRATVPIFGYTLAYKGRVYEFDWIR